MAVGMNKLRIFNMIMMETVFLSITGGIIGIIISIITISYTGKQGINLTFLAEGINAWGYSAIVYPEVQGYVYGIIAVLVIITAMFSSIYPARRALKLNPAVAVRMEA
jgi:ABC-type antimicrobial peptide transport system permease subunit